MALVQATSRPGSAATRMAAYTEHQYPSGSPGSSPSPVKNRLVKVTFDLIGVDVPSEQMLRDMFNQFDSNHNGFIDRQEFKEFMMGNVENFGAPTTSAEIDRLFAKLNGGYPTRRRRVPGENLDQLTFEQFSVIVLSRMAM
jgi:hypothetical protein